MTLPLKLLNLTYRQTRLPVEAGPLFKVLQRGDSLSAEQFGLAQQLLNQVGKQPVPEELITAVGGRNVVIPHLSGEGLQTYAQAVVPNTVEILFHPNIHGSMRVGNQWFDFTNNDAWTHVAGTVNNVSTAKRVGDILRKYPNGEGQQGAIGVNYFLPPSRINQLRKTLAAEVRGLQLPSRGRSWANQDPNTHTCLSAATSLLERHAPELGIPTIWGPEFFANQLGGKAPDQATYAGFVTHPAQSYQAARATAGGNPRAALVSLYVPENNPVPFDAQALARLVG